MNVAAVPNAEPPSGRRPMRLDRATRSLLAAAAVVIVFLFALSWLLSLMPWPIGGNAKQLARATLVTVELTATAGFVGLVIGVATALGQRASFKPVQWLCRTYVWVMRGTPLLLQILFVFFALPVLLPGLELSDFQSAALALGLNIGAYNAEAVRAGLLAVPRGQLEAAQALGLNRFALLQSVILPQALRVALPPLVNNAVSLLKDSSLAYAIGVVELSNAACRIQAATFEPVPVLLTSAAIYLMLTTGITQACTALELRLDVEARTNES